MLSREDKQLINATRHFTKENPVLSWWYVSSTFILLLATITGTFVFADWSMRLLSSIVAGLLIVRSFILYHDFMHGTILRNSKFADFIFTTYGLLIMTPKRVWKETHNYHHAHTAKIATSHIGSYKMVTIHMWKRMNVWQRLGYKFIRHPINFVLSIFTMFAYGMCIAPIQRNIKQNWDSLLALVLHITLAIIVIIYAGYSGYFLSLLLPLMIGATIGSYLFYAQHNFPGVDVKPINEWDFVYASLASSSFMKMGAIMNWITGNIGYHHIHHLNSKIPFYRLPEAMENIPELQHPITTTLKPIDIYQCFQLKLWDPENHKMVGYTH